MTEVESSGSAPDHGLSATSRHVLLPDVLSLASRATELPWEPFQEGVERCWLYRDGEFGPAAALLRFQPGASVPEHAHLGFEHILLLAGSQSDELGDLQAGDFAVHAPGTRHRVATSTGCLALAIYEKRVAFGASHL
jgi:predicted ChrR family anti-sigma factor